VKLSDALDIEIMTALPTFALVVDTDDVLGRVSNAPELLPLTVPIQPLKLILNVWLKEYANVFVPSLLCAITVDPLANVLVVLLPIPTVFVPLYAVPLIFTLQALDADELIAPDEPDISCKLQLIVLVLSAIE